MPYLPKKTWIEMAPTINGLSVPESPYGMGQGSQSATNQSSNDLAPLDLPAVNPFAAYNQEPYAALQSATNAPTIDSSSSLFSSANLGYWLAAGGGVLLLIAVMAGMKK